MPNEMLPTNPEDANEAQLSAAAAAYLESLSGSDDLEKLRAERAYLLASALALPDNLGHKHTTAQDQVRNDPAPWITFASDSFLRLTGQPLALIEDTTWQHLYKSVPLSFQPIRSFDKSTLSNRELLQAVLDHDPRVEFTIKLAA
jgi:hypothetical protein